MPAILNKIFLYGSLFIGVVPMGIALYNYFFLKQQHKWVLYKIVFHLLIVCVSVFVRFKGPNFFLYYILCFGLAITIHFIFVRYYNRSIVRTVARLSTVLYLLFLLLDAFVLSGTNTYKNSSFTLFDFWAITVIIIYLGQTLKNTHIRRLRDYPMFWISIGIAIPYLASLLHFLLSSSALIINIKLFFVTENMSLMGNIAGSVLQAIGFWKCRKTAIDETLFKKI
ncbi:hypothetical protein [Runella sp.]|uniref:hypothetical protein n=1 Tax=Runella sp. TaxID=1960881 RepID=UPI003D0D1704